MFFTMYLITLITFYLFIGLCCCNIRNNNVNYNNVRIERYPYINKNSSDDEQEDDDELEGGSIDKKLLKMLSNDPLLAVLSQFLFDRKTGNNITESINALNDTIKEFVKLYKEKN